MEFHGPKISVVTPCYNAGRFLRETLASAIGQTRPPLEVIVVDDGSTDGSAAIAESFGPPVRVIRQANQGESVARNVGIAAAGGDYIAFLDADDLLDRGALEAQMRAVVASPGAVSLMGFAFFEQDPSRPSMVRMPDVAGFFPWIIGTNFGPPHTWLVPREIAVRVGGFDADLRWFEDWEFWTRVAMTGVPLVTVPYLGALYRQHRASQLATTKAADRARGHVLLMERLCTAMAAREDLARDHGVALFWEAWAALAHARSKGVPWGELGVLAGRLEGLAREGPDTVRRLRLARVVRYLGARRAGAIRDFWARAAPGDGAAAV